ncbi:hypothetical protein U1769_18300 [Sphingomonas sp. ZT3P38]
MLAAALQAQPVGPAPITITPDNVDLDGAGTFTFEPDRRAFNVDPPVGGDGLSLTVRLWFNPAGEPVACDVGETPLVQAAQTGCGQLMESATFRTLPGMVTPLQRGFVDVEFSFFKGAPGGAANREMFVFAVPGYRNVPILYPPDQASAADQLHKADGIFSIPVQADDYPSIAIRLGLESASAVQLGISRDGSVKSCRPISTSGLRTAYLDNYSCMLFLRRGHFEFSSDAPSYEGLRYLNQTMHWRMPED